MLKPSKLLASIILATTLGGAFGCGADTADQRSGRNAAAAGGEGVSKPQGATATPKAPGSGVVKPIAASTKKTRALAILGGYLSCGQDELNPFQGTSMAAYQAMIAQKLTAAGEAAAPYVMSCFTYDPSKVTYVTSDAPNRPQAVAFEQFVIDFKAFLSRAGDASLYTVGHSYGGWLGMRLTRELAPTTELAALVTLDPISRIQCTPSAMAPAVFNDQPAPECTRAPGDFGPQDLALIAQKAKTWLNIYQTDARYLHSAVIQSATNVRQAYPTVGLDAHSKIFTDPAVVAQVLKALGL